MSSNVTWLMSHGDVVMTGDELVIVKGDATYVVRVEEDVDVRPHDYDCYSPEMIEAWENDEWRYVALSVYKQCDECDNETHMHGVCGYEANMPGHEFGCALWLTQQAYELVDEVAA